MLGFRIRKFFSALFNPQERELKINSEVVERIQKRILKSVIGAKAAGANTCPVPFQAFFGLEDNIVPKASAQGIFVEVKAIPGDHSTVLRPNGIGDDRYRFLKRALLNPIGHPSVYQFRNFEMELQIAPNDKNVPILLNSLHPPVSVPTDNVAIRTVKVEVSENNRCVTPFEQMYRSNDGYVQPIDDDGNETDKATQSEYLATGKKFSYLFTPQPDQTVSFSLKILNGFGAGQRNWHNHMKPDVHYQRFRFVLDLGSYKGAYVLSEKPAMWYHDQDVYDHQLCELRPKGTLVPCSKVLLDGYYSEWVVPNVRGGVIDVAWDFK